MTGLVRRLLGFMQPFYVSPMYLAVFDEPEKEYPILLLAEAQGRHSAIVAGWKPELVEEWANSVDVEHDGPVVASGPVYVRELRGLLRGARRQDGAELVVLPHSEGVYFQPLEQFLAELDEVIARGGH